MEKLYSVTEAARYLGISRDTVYRQVLKGNIKAVRLKTYGRPWRIPGPELERLVSIIVAG